MKMFLFLVLCTFCLFSSQLKKHNNFIQYYNFQANLVSVQRKVLRTQSSEWCNGLTDPQLKVVEGVLVNLLDALVEGDGEVRQRAQVTPFVFTLLRKSEDTEESAAAGGPVTWTYSTVTPQTHTPLCLSRTAGIFKVWYASHSAGGLIENVSTESILVFIDKHHYEL